LVYKIEKANSEQAALVAELINDHELTIEPEGTPTGLAEATELLEGFFDPSLSAFLVDEQTNSELAFYSINPDSNRKRLFSDVYARPSSGLLENVIAESLKAAVIAFSDYEHWYGVNSKDQQMREALESFGMQAIRTYWHLKTNLSEKQRVPIDEPNVSIRLISGEADMQIWWALHQDAFSKHFGFAPRPRELWIKQTLSAGTMDPEGCFLLEYQGQPAGFAQLANSNYHLNGAYLDLLGVAHKFQGRGLGKALLQHAINFSIDQGRSFIELNVDTGNESGALKLYEKLGFKPNSSWVQYENKNWAEVAKGL
jgi:ribosomal protein S18 acetylase RimI-like enzyme